MYAAHSNVLSLADYAALSGFKAVQTAVKRNRNGCNFGRCSISFTFTTGRRTCDNPDDPPTTPVFPKGHDANSTADLKRQFGLTENEMVALLGRKLMSLY